MVDIYSIQVMLTVMKEVETIVYFINHILLYLFTFKCSKIDHLT
jgi:hypothetical protein